MSDFKVVVYDQTGSLETNSSVYRMPGHANGPFTFWVVKNGIYYGGYDSIVMADLAIRFFKEQKKNYTTEKIDLIYFELPKNTECPTGLVQGATHAIALVQIAERFIDKFSVFATAALKNAPPNFQLAYGNIQLKASQPATSAVPKSSQTPSHSITKKTI